MKGSVRSRTKKVVGCKQHPVKLDNDGFGGRVEANKGDPPPLIAKSSERNGEAFQIRPEEKEERSNVAMVATKSEKDRLPIEKSQMRRLVIKRALSARE